MQMAKKNIIILVIAILQAAFFISWFAVEGAKLSDPKSKVITVKILPFDPRDYISGNYLALRYEFSSAFSFKNRDSNSGRYDAAEKEVYAVLTKQGDSYIPGYFSYTKPKIKEDQVAIKGKAQIYGSFTYGIEKYFIGENVKQPNFVKDKVEAVLVIDDECNAMIKNLLVNGAKFTPEENSEDSQK